MYGPIKCQCGKDLGIIYPTFCEMRRNLIKQNTKKYQESDETSYYKMSLDTDLDFNLSDIYKELKIDKMCCKMVLSTTIEFDEVY